MDNYLICIADQRTPLVVFFGPRASGKMMGLLRLSRYLECRGLIINSDPILRPAGDSYYMRRCEHFCGWACLNLSPGDICSYRIMLVKVIHQGKPICQILKLLGEHCFDDIDVHRPFPAYFNAITNIPNRKVRVFFVEENWGRESSVRGFYAAQIYNMENCISPQDKVIFLCGKVDCSAHFRAGECPNEYAIF